MVFKTGDNNYGVAKWIVDATTGQGTHTTIAGALTSASSGETIFVRPGSYTEDLTLKAGVDIVSFAAEGDRPNVTIIGKATATFAGTCTISGIRLQTNSDFFLVNSGSAATIVNLEYCYLNCANNTGISFTTASTSARVNLIRCLGNLATTGIAFFANSSTGVMQIRYCDFSNSGSSLTANTISAGQVDAEYSIMASAITTSSTGFITGSYLVFNLTSLNLTCLTIGGGTGGVITNSYLTSGTASTVSISAAGFQLVNCLISSSNTNAITGAGSLSYASLQFGSSSNLINTTTQSALIVRNGISLSAHQPAFLAYLGSQVNNVTGSAATQFQLGTTTALTEVFDQNSNFVTSGTFTAPYTGKYFVQANTYLTGCTINTVCQTRLLTSNRTYLGACGRGASSIDSTSSCSAVADFDAADTMTVTVLGSGEAGNTDDLFGDANCTSYISGFLLC